MENLAPTGIHSPDRPAQVAIPTELPGPQINGKYSTQKYNGKTAVE